MRHKLWDPWAELDKFELANGLTVYHQYWDRPWLGASFIIHAGAREDSFGRAGLAHYLEHCASQNIPGRPFDQVQRFFRELGAGTNFGATSYLGTNYGFFIPLRDGVVEKTFDIFGGLMFGAKITKELEREKRIIQQEFTHHYPFRASLDWDMAPNRALFKGHRLENYNRPLGIPEQFTAVTSEELQTFYDRYYVPANAAAVFVGGLKLAELKKALNGSPLAREKAGERNKPWPEFSPLPEPVVNREEVQISSVIAAPTASTGYSIGWTLPRGLKPDALRLTRAMLSQLLDDRVRQELGSTYSFRASFWDQQDIYEFSLGGKIEPDKMEQIEELAWHSINELPEREDLFKLHRSSRLNGLQLTDISGEGLADSVALDLESDQQITTLAEAIKNTEVVTFAQIKEVVSYLSPARSFTFILKP